ncbi:unnamed protein product [Ilex paraguariensis]|uniref:RRM domain-containing protein n=1 Tax=Ilex paraguariensis TaxID=185542 RepID=A0ABC8T965_9AQUA
MSLTLCFDIKCDICSPVEGAKRGRTPPPQSKKVSPPPRKASPIPESLVLHVDQLTRNVNENHLREIFSTFGEVVHVRLAMDHTANCSKGFGYVGFKTRGDAEKAQFYMDGAQVDGNVVRTRFTLPERKKASSPPRTSAPSRRDAPKSDTDGADVETDGPKRQRESSPRRKPLSPSQRRSSVARRGSPRRNPDSPPRRLADSPVRRRAQSPYRRRDSPPPRRRPASPARGRSPSSPPRRNRSPRASPRRMRGSPVRRRSPLPPRRRSPRRARSPPRRSPIHRRSRSPLRRPARSYSRSISPQRGRAPGARRGRSSSNSSPSPRKFSENLFLFRPLRGRSTSNSSSSSSLPHFHEKHCCDGYGIKRSIRMALAAWCRLGNKIKLDFFAKIDVQVKARVLRERVKKKKKKKKKWKKKKRRRWRRRRRKKGRNSKNRRQVVLYFSTVTSPLTLSQSSFCFFFLRTSNCYNLGKP